MRAFSLCLCVLFTAACGFCGSDHAAAMDGTGPGTTVQNEGDLVVEIGTLTLDGSHTFASVILRYGGGLTHSPGSPGGLDLTVLGDMVVDLGSFVRVTGCGQPGGTGPGAGSAGEINGGGGGYGGCGSVSSGGSAGGDAYGSLLEPADFGSGGGMNTSGGQPGGSGGGIVRLTVNGTLHILGGIYASGGDTVGSGSGAGSGGSIWISTNVLSGNGIIIASGGNCNRGDGGGGGGGRIAVYYNTSSFTGLLQAAGGGGGQWGAPGTVYKKPSAQPLGDLSFYNVTISATVTPLAPPCEFNSVTIGNDLVRLDSPLTTASLTVGGGSTLTCRAGLPFPELNVAGTATIGGTITANAKGNPADTGPGCGGGAGHGGCGGRGKDAIAGGGIYGSMLEPIDLGSGGGSDTLDGQPGGAGGGAIRIIAGTLQLDGSITANGGNAPGGAGAGSGGSIWITAGTLAGAGTISALGGYSIDSNGGGGGGGRIALYAATDTFKGTVQAAGWAGFEWAGAGTVYRKSTAQMWGDLVIQNIATGTAPTPLTPPIQFDTVTLQNAWPVNLEGPLTAGTLNVSNGGYLTCRAGQPMPLITAVDAATVNGSINLSGKGHGSASGPGAGASGTCGGGAGHGGCGGRSRDGLAAGAAYGSILEPTGAGSGGGDDTSHGDHGGAGGGALRMIVGGTLSVNGSIASNGINGPGSAGGGSGGSIWLTIGTLAGSGTISATGGQSPSGAGGGGAGGRIAIHCDTDSFAGSLQAQGAGGYEWAGAGTIYRRSAALPLGSLVIQNPTTGTAPTPLDPPGAFDTVTLQNAWPVRLEGPLTVGTLNVANNGFLTCAAGQPLPTVTVNGSATVTGAINVNGKGNGAASGPGAGASGRYGGGAGHGGEGGASASGCAAGGIYGSTTGPVDLGSGGGSDTIDGGDGGAGGGAIRITVAGTLQVDGTISADGVNVSGGGGGGSGGSVWLSMGSLTGSGSISASGGRATDGLGGGGGGGRIAICCGVTPTFARVYVDGGAGAHPGLPGTIHNCRFWRIPGDANDDCRVNILDLIFVRNRLNGDPATGDNWRADVNEDTKINILDLLYVRNRLNNACP